MLLVLSGILLGMAYPPNPVGLLGSIGLVPLLIALERTRSIRTAMRWSYVTMLLFSAISSWWIGSWQARADKFLMISCVLLIIIHPLFFVLPMVLYKWVRNRTSRYVALLFLPFLWCAGEYLHALGDASYPWLTLGNTQTYNLYYIQFIEFTGIWGLSFLLLLQNVVFGGMLLALDEGETAQRRVFRIGGGLLALTLVPPFIYGFIALGQAESARPPKSSMLTVTVVQPNVDPWEKWNTADTTDHIRLSGDLSLAAKRKKPADMYLWVETAVPQPVTMPGYEGEYQRWRAMVDSIGVPVLTGFPDYVEYHDRASTPPSSKKSIRAVGNGFDTLFYDHFNSAGLFVPHRGLVGAYHKMQLVPFGERIPFVDNFPWLISMLSWDVGISTWGKGTSIATMRVPFGDTSTLAASVVCFESVYPNMVRKFVDSGANFLTIITNDGWYMGTPGPLQHERFAIMRAIETRRSIARAANTGISGFVTPYGALVNETEENQRTTTTASIELRDDRTLYVRWGDWWPQLCLVVTVAMVGYAGVRGYGRTRG